MADIKVKDLTDTQTINTDNEIMVLTNKAQNQVQNITVGNLLSNFLSSDNGNVLEQGTDGKLYVETPENITGELSDLSTTEKSSLVGAINEVNSDLTTEVTNRTNAVSGEATIRANVDNNLQSQIDAITAASDVTDIVGTYAELQAYDTTELPDNSIIKVLQDESRQNETTYYRWVITDGVGAWVLIGEEGPYYTISQADSKFVTQATVGNLNNLTTSDKSSVVNAMNELASVLDPTQTADYIKNSKAIYSGEVSENALILPQIKEMAHSTFDLSKFTVVGSPTITDDGIASGFDSANYAYIPNINLSDANSWEIVTPYYDSSYMPYWSNKQLIRYLASGDVGITILNGNNSSTGARNISFTIRTVSGPSAIVFSSNTFANNVMIRAKLVFNNGTYTAFTQIKGSDWVQVETAKSGDNIPDLSLQRFSFVAFPSPYNYAGSFDLKEFYINKNGSSYFSGNKTGIDTIKPDDYAVVGTPTISADGVASGFSSSNYLTKSLSAIPLTSEIRIVSKGVYQQNNNNILWSINALGLRAQVYPSQIQFFGSFTGQTNITISGISLQNNDELLIDFTLKLGDIKIKVYQNGSLIKSITSSYTYDTTTTLTTLTVGRYSNQYWRGSIDLNAFKIYVDGDLVYQPCLKIPYTESKTGSKIVDSIYRDRVSDMADQFGYAPYYTLSDTDFTLPMGEIYGMLERKSNIDLSNTTPAQTFKDNSIAWGMPDWSKIVAKAANTLYTATQRGWIEAVVTTQNPGMALQINGYTVAYCEAAGSNDTSGFGCLVPVDIGDSYQLVNNGGVISAFNFIPCKGEA